MTDRRWAFFGTALITVILLVSSLGLLPGLVAARPSDAPGPVSVEPAAQSGGSPATPNLPSLASSSYAPPVRASSTSSSSSVYGIAEAENAIAENQLNRSAVFFPRAPAPGEALRPGGEVTAPTYPGIPAPMGLADVGQGLTGPYAYETNGFNGTIRVNSFDDYNPGYSVFGSSPDWMTFQLNTVTDNTSYPGAANGDFWIQNVAHFNGTSLQFEDNIWNFSSPATCMEAGTILSGQGQVSGCIYYDYGAILSVRAPFTLSLYSGVTLVPGLGGVVPQVTFSYLINEGGVVTAGTYDTVTFDGLGSASAPPQFEVNGNAYTPTGYTLWDAEIILGGNGGGSNAVLQEINATAQLEYLGSSSRYVSIPSAYDYGADTGETSYGVAATYDGTTENLTTGPSMLYGLWNTTNGPWGDAASSTTWNLRISGLPNYAFAFLQNNSQFVQDLPSLSYWPAAVDGTLTTRVPALLDSNYYTLAVYANGYATGDYSLTGSTNLDVTTAHDGLTPEPTVFDTPVYLSSDAQAASFGASGVPGVQADPGNLWINDTAAVPAAPFLLTNDFEFPTFVLFAALNLSTNVSLDRFVQSATTFNYTSSGESSPTFLPGWTQGYYFNFGSGRFAVANTSVVGNSSLYYSSNEADVPLPAVEFWWTFQSNASNIATGGDDFGVDVYFGSGTSLFNVSASGGANAIVLYATTDVRAVDVYATGADLDGVPSLAVDAETVLSSTIDGVSASTGSEALEVANATGDVIANLGVAGGAAGVIEDSTATSLEGVSLDGIAGLDLLDCENFSAENVSVLLGDGIGLGDSVFVNVTKLSATDGGTGLLAQDSSFLNLTNIRASDGSIGAVVEEGSAIRGSNLSASGDSIAFGAELSLNLTLRNLSVTSGSLGLLSIENDWLNLTRYNASESALAPNYFGSTVGIVPTAAVFSVGDQNTSVYAGTAVNYDYGVVSNGSNHLSVSNLDEVGGVYGVALNDTGNTSIFDALLYGDQIGLWANATSNVTVEVSTIEASTGYGLWVDDGLNSIVTGSNFVGNNGASTNGVFDSSHLQAGAAGTTTIQFNYENLDNYWSDWNPTVGPYAIAPGISDPAPLQAFFAHWLAFPETGLPAGTVWGITLDGLAYDSGLPLVIVPSYTLGDPVLAYSVDTPELYEATPASGSVDYTGTNTTVPISFNATEYGVRFVETGLASGATWKATLDGVTVTGTASTIDFLEPTGTYTYAVSAAGYTVSPSSGSATVPGSDTTIDVMFTPIPTYAVTFAETGLAAATNWTVALNGTLESSTTSAIDFDEPNGVYDYSVDSVAGYTISPASTGSVTVSGAAEMVDLTFTAVPTPTYAVTFSETGLAAGTSWSVTIGSTTDSSDNATVIAHEPAGSYDYTIGPVANYTAVPASGSVTVTNTAQAVSVAFTAVALPPHPTTNKTPTLFGFPTLDWAIIGVVAGVIIVGLLVALLVGRRGRSGSTDDEESGSSDSPPDVD